MCLILNVWITAFYETLQSCHQSSPFAFTHVHIASAACSLVVCVCSDELPECSKCLISTSLLSHDRFPLVKIARMHLRYVDLLWSIRYVTTVQELVCSRVVMLPLTFLCNSITVLYSDRALYQSCNTHLISTNTGAAVDKQGACNWKVSGLCFSAFDWQKNPGWEVYE